VSTASNTEPFASARGKNANTRTEHQLSLTGHGISVRFSFAFFGVNERYGDLSTVVEQVALFAVALRLGRLTIFPGIVDVDVILNCAFSGLREADLQMGTIAPFITLNHSETNNQIVRAVGLEFGEISAFGQRLYQKVAVLVRSCTLEARSATLPVLIGHEQREWLLS
jgi:hypothetical protein